ncbi:hypothetical protein F4811DRAFT_555934 [Daldinia bambusicola]|nr:hypothetical protein F4811DRAFT_555934 [Daldinia bambusicola]
MYLSFFTSVLLALFQGSSACLHNHIRTPKLQDVQDALSKRSVPAAVKTAITNVRVFDGYTIGEPETVIIDGEYITDCDDNIQHTIDGGNRILIPGLIDAHSHVITVEGLENNTAYGVTTIFNMACSDIEICLALKSNPGLTSVFTTLLPALGPSGGNTQLNTVLPEQVLRPGADPKALVGYSFNNGSDYFKVVGELDGPTQNQYDEIVNHTHSLGQFTVAHAAGNTPYTRAVSAGVDVVQHIPDDALLCSSVIQAMKEHNLAATPTMEIFRRAYTIQPEIGQFLRGNKTSNNSATTTTYENVLANVRSLYEAGVPILAGTDAVGSTLPIVYIPFGDTLHQELVNLVDIGMTPAEALRAATLVPATVHRLNDRGAIRPGLRADLVLLNSDPLVNISNTRDIAKVWVGGIEYPNVAKSSFLE